MFVTNDASTIRCVGCAITGVCRYFLRNALPIVSLKHNTFSMLVNPVNK